MDQRKFEQLLQSVLQPDTERVKAATAILRKDYYPNPQSLAFLLQILASHESPQLRQLAAVEARTLVAKHWTAVPAGSKPEVRMMLLQTTLAEQENLVRHSAARVIAAVASIDLENKEWLDLPTTLQQAASSQDAAQREVGVYILYTLLDTMGDGFVESTGPLFSLFEKTIQDPQSAEVRLNTMLALSRIGMAMDPEEDGDSLAAFRRAVPSMVAVLKEAVDSGDEKRAENAFEVFQILLTCDTSLLASHFQDLVQFMTTLASSKEIPDESRTQALSFLMQCVKHRRMRIQGLKLGEPLTLKAMEIVTELGDLRNDVEEAVPAQTALGLLDALSQSLPPAQVIVPLLKALPHYVDNQNPAYRRAGILSLGFCVEGAPDFIGTQLKDIIPIVLRLLDDPEVKVRQAALNAFARLAEDLAEEMAVEHEKLMAALIKNLDAAGTPDGHKSEDEQRMDIIIGVCSALDSLVDGLDPDDAATYVPELVPRLSRLFTHPEFRVKTVAIAALGSLAGNGKDSFKPYFEELMTGLSPYVTIKDSEDELDLRGAVCDAMGSMATAVGPEAFQKYVQPLMTSSEEALQLGHSNLRESTFILWSTLAKVYKDDFSPFLPGVMKGLFDCLDQDEGQLEMGLGEEAQALLGPEIIVGGKKIKISGDENGLATLHKAGEDETDIIDIDDLDDDDDAWDDFAAGSGVALEKEIALEVIGDVLTHIEDQFLPYLQQTMEKTMELIEHSYEGVRKAAIGTMWRTYATFFQLSEKQGKMAKWQPGIPVKVQPTHDLVQLGDLVMKATLATWSEELDRATVTDIHRSLAATFKVCGPAVIGTPENLHIITTTALAVIRKQHPCQQDIGDDDDEFEDIQESSEYDWLVIDTAFDVVVGLAKALGPSFGELWKIFEKPIMKYASSNEGIERSTSVGAIAECTEGMGAAVTPYTSSLLKLCLHRLSDEDSDARSNAAYATGVLCKNSTADDQILAAYATILTKLEPLLQTDNVRLLDNSAGCVSRMIMKHPDRVPLDDVLPVVVGLLPLKEDYEENVAVWGMIVQLYQESNPAIRDQTEEIIAALAQVLSPPTEQLLDETREKLVELVKYLHKHQPGLISGNGVLMHVVQG